VSSLKEGDILKPIKKSNMGIYLAVVTLFVTLFVALHAAGAFYDVSVLQEQGSPDVVGAGIIDVFIESLTSRISEPLALGWYENSQIILIVCFLVWLLTVAHIATSRKNTIAGKEHGTAKWGGLNDIKDLFSENILKNEMRKAKKTAFILTRVLAKRKVFKDAKKDGDALYAVKMDRLKDEVILWRERDKLDKKTCNENFNKRKKAIKKEAEEMERASRLEGWLPLKIENEYTTKVNELNLEYSSSPLFNQKNHLQLIKEAKIYRDKRLRNFFSGRGKVEALKLKFTNADALLTRSERTCLFNYKINNNILIIGGSGSGKTRGFSLPNLLQAHSSFVVTDPKGEILEKCGYFLKEYKGYDIRVLNLDNKSLSDGYNPFEYIYPDRAGYEERVLELIEAIILNTDGGEKRNSNDPFWDKAERLFLQAIFFFVCSLPPHDRNMNSVLKFIQMLEIEEERDKRNSKLDLYAEWFAYGRFRESFKKQRGIEQSPDVGDVVDDERVVGAGKTPEHIGYQQFIEFRSKASGKTAKSIVISAVARLAPFRTKEVRRIFSYDTMNLRELGEKKMAIFVVVPPTTSAYNFIAGILFTQMFQELQYCATEKYKHEGQKLPIPVRFILDEFANTCTIPNFIKILSYARSFGIGIIPILQSLEQIKEMYKDEWQVIIDNCSSRLFLGNISSMDTLEYVSKMIGKGTYDKRTTGRTRSKQGSSSLNWDVIGRELLDPAELSKLPKDDCVLMISGRNPFYSKKYEYTSHPNYRFTSDANPAYAYDHVPITPDNAFDDIALESTHGEDIFAFGDNIKPFVAPQRVNFVTDPIVLHDAIAKGSVVPMSNDVLDIPEEESLSEGRDIALASLNEELEKRRSDIEDSAFGVMASIFTPRIEFVTDPAKIATELAKGISQKTVGVIPNDVLDPDFDVKNLSDYELNDLDFILGDDERDIEAEYYGAIENMFNSLGLSVSEQIDMLSSEHRDTEQIMIDGVAS